MRLFDTTERTGVRRHGTERECPVCTAELRDSIVHFGEKSPGLKTPYNWEEAAEAADNADVIVCLGTSLKVKKCNCCICIAICIYAPLKMSHFPQNMAQRFPAQDR